MTQYTPEVTIPGAGTENLTESDSYQLLSAERRRIALDVLDESSGPLGLDDLAERVARRQKDVDYVDDRSVEKVAVLLHHVHLPKMDEFGVVDYDADATSVELVSGR